jgi:hypothetical protein
VLLLGCYDLLVDALTRDFQDLLALFDARIVAALDAFGFASLGLAASDFAEHGVVIQLGREPGRVDLLTGVTGLVFEETFARRETVHFGDLAVPVIDRGSLITNKRASARPQDLADVAKLEKGQRT